MLVKRVKNHLVISFEKKEFFAEKYNKNVYFSDEKSPIRTKISSCRFKELEQELKTIPENKWFEIAKFNGKYFICE
jgi:hypothetical protein